MAVVPTALVTVLCSALGCSSPPVIPTAAEAAPAAPDESATATSGAASTSPEAGANSQTQGTTPNATDARRSAAKGPPTTETLLKIVDLEWKLAGVLGLDIVEVYLAGEQGVSAETKARVLERIAALRERASKTLKTTWGAFRFGLYSIILPPNSHISNARWPIEDEAELARISAKPAPWFIDGHCAELISWVEVYDKYAQCLGKASSQFAKIAKGEAERQRRTSHNAVVLEYHLATGKGGYMYDTSLDTGGFRTKKFADTRVAQCTALELQATCFNKREETALSRGAVHANYIANARKVPLGRACAEGDGHACTELGGLVADLSPDRTAFLFRKACELGVVRACSYDLEYQWDDQRVLPSAHYAQVLPAYQKSCDAGDLTGCRQLGLTYQTIARCFHWLERGWLGDPARHASSIYSKLGACGETQFALGLQLAGGPTPEPECATPKDCPDDRYWPSHFSRICHAGECIRWGKPGRAERAIRLALYDTYAKACALDFELCTLQANAAENRGKFILDEKLRTLSPDAQLALDDKPLDPDCKRALCYPAKPTRRQRSNMKRWAKTYAKQCKRLEPYACKEHHFLMLEAKYAGTFNGNVAFGAWPKNSKHVSALWAACYAGQWSACHNLVRADYYD
jgi:hypothetical protein